MTNMKLLPLACLCLLTRSATTFADEQRPEAIRVEEDSDVTLTCSLSSKENITSKLFDWRKDDQKEVFFYDGRTSSLSGQDQQFKGRVSHFQEELKSGNASIIIRKTKVADSGVYSCIFPNLQPRQIFHIQLVVDRILKDRSGENIPGFLTESPKESSTGLDVAFIFSFAVVVFASAVVAVILLWYSQRGPPKESSTESPKEFSTESPKESANRLDYAVLAVAVVALIPLWYSHTEFPTESAVLVPAVLCTVVVVVLALYLVLEWAQHLRRFPTRRVFAVDVAGCAVDVVFAVALLALIPLWYSQTESPAGWAVAVLSTVVVVVLALYLVLKWAPHLRGQRTNSNAMTENVCPNQNGEESPVFNVSGEDEQDKGHVSHGPDELNELKHGPHDDLLY